MWEYITFDDLLDIYGITQDDLTSIDPSFIDKIDENGAYFWMNDSNENGLPDFYDSYLGVDVDLRPSQGVVVG